MDLLDILGGLRTYEGFALVGESPSVPCFGSLSSVLSYDVKNRPRKGGGLSFLVFPLVYTQPNGHGCRYVNKYNTRDLESGLNHV